jgi:predicted PurR-regulated permease PerM
LIVAALVLLVLWLAGHALLLVGAGILVAALLHAASLGLAWLTGLGRRVCLALVCLALLAALGLAGWSVAPDLAGQLRGFLGEVRAAWNELKGLIDDFALGRQALRQLEGGPGQEGGGVVAEAAQQGLSIVSATVGGLTDAVIILILGVYLAAEPGVYLRGLLHLAPLARRARLRQILLEMARTLREWLLGQLAAMLVVGLATGLGLWLIGVPYAALLGMIAGLLDFIPNLGPLLALAPALLVAFGADGASVPYVLLLYLGIQTLEGYVLTPMIQRRAVDLPPALTIAAQVVMGLLGGGLGLLLAVPLAAVLLVAVRMAYVEDVLGEAKG